MKTFAASNDPKIARYLETTFHPEDSVLKEVRERSLRSGLPDIQVGPMDALHLEVLARAMNAEKAVEIGTLAGYSGIALLRGLRPEGRLFTFEYDPKHAGVARESFAKAGFSDRVELYLGPAAENLPKIEKNGPFDLVFIDADKESYPAYLDWAARNLRGGGLVVGDNTLAFGMIADERIDDPEDRASVEAIRKFNREAAQGGRFRATLLPTGEGLTIAVKVR